MDESHQHRILLPCLPYIAICEEEDALAVGAGGSWGELGIAWYLHIRRVGMAPSLLGTELAQATTNPMPLDSLTAEGIRSWAS
jgi:hypothetical protein